MMMTMMMMMWLLTANQSELVLFFQTNSCMVSGLQVAMLCTDAW